MQGRNPIYQLTDVNWHSRCWYSLATFHTLLSTHTYISVHILLLISHLCCRTLIYFKTLVKYGSTIFYHLLQNKSVGVWRYTHLFWKVLCTHFFRKCLELYRGNIFQVFVELQWHSFEIICPIENLHVEAFLVVFALLFCKIHIICKKWATFWSADAKNFQINFYPLIF